MRAIDVIMKKRDGEALSQAEITFFIDGVTRSTIPDYQISAWLMAVLLRGMSPQETTLLTDAMVHSGVKVDLRTIPGVISGGVTANAASTVTNIAGGFNINGTRGAQHEYTIDGVTNLNLGNNTGALVSINPDALQEVKVLTSNYQAEFGRAGGGFIALTTRGDDKLASLLDRSRDMVLELPAAPALLTPVVMVLPLQLLAYDIAVRRGCDVDQPRNLAKSVTVE